jgi:DNA-directed RNA polymerase beta' subunit
MKRLLTLSELNDVFRGLPNNKPVIVVRNKLASLEVDEDKIDILRDKIQHKYYTSLMTSGESVGILTSLCIGEPTTQLVLNSFHGAGYASNRLRGVPRLKELLNASPDPKRPTMTIYFTSHPRTIYDLPHKSDLVETSLGDLVLSTDLMDKPEDTWYILYEHLFREIPSDAKCIRVYLNRERMHKSRITVMDIHRLINGRRQTYDKSSTILSMDDDSRSREKIHIRIWSVPGPMTTDHAVIDFYTRMDAHLNDDELHKKAREIMNTILKVVIKGVKRVKEVFFSRDRDGEWFIQTSGSNLRAVFAFDDVDYQRTMTDNLREVKSVFGIEAARLFLETEIKTLITEGGSPVHPAHFKLLVDSMVYMGKIVAVARYRLDMDQHGVFSLATFEQHMTHIVNAAQYNISDTLNGVSGSIIMGRLAPMGSGVVDVHLDTHIYEEEETIREWSEETIHERIPELEYLTSI